MQEGTPDRRCRSHPSQCTTSLEDRQIVRMVMTDRSVTSRTIAHLRICLQRHDGRMRFWRHRGKWILNSCVMYCHFGPAPVIMVWGGIGYESHSPLVRIAGTLNSHLYIPEVLEPVVLPTFIVWPKPYFNRIMRDHTWHVLSKGSSSITD
ncbi:transposable element Tcb1 transposase [Trichonephila clavipes]|nr:transposable element Tcb1 transposase [Trichonephila clavipes]